MYDLFIRCLNAEYKETKHSGNYAIEIEGDTIYVLFQHSRGWIDWFNNFNFPKKPYKRMNEKWYAHRGFLKVWKGMRDEIECEISNNLTRYPNIKNIVCIGYSHGGALSLLATEDMKFLYGNTLNVFGFGYGAPRVIWGTIPESLKHRVSCYFNIRNKGDIVTHLPPKVFGFKDSGALCKVGRIFKYNPIRAHRSSSYITELQTIRRTDK